MRKRVVAVVALLMFAALLTVPGSSGGGAASASSDVAPLEDQQRHPDYYKNLVAPRSEASDEVLTPSEAEATPEWWAEQMARHSGGFPPAARQLAKLEAKAQRTGKSPRQLKIEAAGAPPSSHTQVAQVLTVLAEFDPNANDDFSGFERPKSTQDDSCFTEPDGTLLSGPLHNNLSNPATRGRHTDNNTFWVPNFSRDHFNKLLFTETGLTERVRKDLTGPDGNPGINMRGYTMRNMYLEMSKGAYTVDGDVAPWVELPHSEAWYGADTCEAGIASDVGHPDNERGVAQMVVDALDELNETHPNFDWDRYDQEDQADLDNDGDLFEPNGVIDHFNIVHAGADEADDGGDQGTYAVWSHSSVVDPLTGGYEIEGTGLKVFNYIVQPEDAGVGVFAHEFGHDLGLPDLYDTSGAADSDVEFWDLMSTGSHSGPIFQSIPIHMGAWDKYVLGWNDPVEIDLGEAGGNFKLGQASKPPAGTDDSVKVNLPNKRVQLGEPHSGDNMWWSSNDQSLADVRLTRTVDVPDSTENVRFWMWNDYQIEEDWDYGFVEVSTDGGASWIQKNVFNEAGERVSTPDDYSDPNLSLGNFGLEHGLTGFTDGWEHHYINLNPQRGETIEVRLRLLTDPFYEERGWFADDFSLTEGDTTIWSDDVESGANGWSDEVVSGAGTRGRGWHIFNGTAIYEQYYLAEWRSLAGFDRGLKYTYDTTYFNDGGEWRVQHVPYNAPGMLVWYRNAQFAQNSVAAPLFNPPSVGPKGTLLLVDSHFDPLRRRGEAARFDPSILDNIPSRPQASNIAFGLRETPHFKSCLEKVVGSYNVACNRFGGQRAIDRFTDRLGWYPGMEWRSISGQKQMVFRDFDASVVVPSRRDKIYSTAFVDKNGDPVKWGYGKVKGGILLGTGDPKDGNMKANAKDVSYGVSFEVLKAASDNSWAVVKVVPGR